jgi:hypothetical protein
MLLVRGTEPSMAGSGLRRVDMLGLVVSRVVRTRTAAWGFDENDHVTSRERVRRCDSCERGQWALLSWEN